MNHGSSTFRRKVLKHLWNYTSEEAKKKIKEPLQDYSEVSMDAAQQADGGSCGVYICFFAKRLAENSQPFFTSIQADQFRIKIAHDLLQPLVLSQQ
jgi:Ulp1 family protease